MRLLWLIGLLLPSLAAEPLPDRVRQRIGGFPGTVSLYAKNLDTGATFGLHEKDPVRTASTIKLPILLAVHDAVAQGKAKWDEPLTLTAANKVSGSGVLASEFTTGVTLPLRDVVNLMIVLSDNTATNLVLERFTADAVNAYLDKIGLPATRSLRKVRGDGSALQSPSGWSTAGKLPENQKYGLGVSTARDMAAIMEGLAKGQYGSAEASRAMLAILKRCQDDTGIRRRLHGLTIYNKTGALDALRSDVALIESPAGRMVMAITVEGIPNVDYSPDNIGSLLIADLAKLLVDELGKPQPH